MEAQVLLKQGAVRRVGTGHSVSISQDPLLPHPNNPYIQSDNEDVKGKMVVYLMIIGESKRDKDLIRDIFDERDFILILSIYPRANEADSWYWRSEKLRFY